MEPQPSSSIWLIISSSSSSESLISYFSDANRSLLSVMWLGSLPSSILLSAAKMALISSTGSATMSSPFMSAVNSSSVTPSLPSELRISNTCSFSCWTEVSWDFALWNPSAFMAIRSSCLSIVPPPSVSKRVKISLIWSSCCWESVICCCSCFSICSTGLRLGSASKCWDTCRAKRVQ